MDKIVSFFILFVFLASCACGDEGLNMAGQGSHLNDSTKEDLQLGSPQQADSMEFTENPEAGEELAGAETAQCCGGYGGYGGGFRRFGGFGGYGGGFSRGYRYNRWGRSWGGGFGGFGCCG